MTRHEGRRRLQLDGSCLTLNGKERDDGDGRTGRGIQV